MMTTSKWRPQNFFLMTSHLNSQRTTDIKPEMLSVVQTGNGTPHDKYNIRGIAHARTNRKDDIFMQRRLVHLYIYIYIYIYIGVGSRDLFIDEAHMALDILPACCLVRFAAFLFQVCMHFMSIHTKHTDIVLISGLFGQWFFWGVAVFTIKSFWMVL